MRTSVVVAAAALCVIAASAIGVSAIQWTSATTDSGDLFFPGVGVTFSFWAAADVRFDTTGVVSTTPLTVAAKVGSNTSYLSAGTVTNYFDGWLLPSATTNDITIYVAIAQPVSPWITACKIYKKAYAPYTFQTVVIAGSIASGFTCAVNQDEPRWFQAVFWTGLTSGAWHSTSMWTFPAPAAGTVDVFVPMTTSLGLRGYTGGQKVFVNLTVSDTRDGDFAQAAAYHGTPSASTPYFTLAPFLYQVTIVNNHGLQGLTQGCTVEMTGAGLDPTSTFACVWQNVDNDVEVASPPAAPSSPTAFACKFPDGLAVMSSANDQIVLVNITTVTTGANPTSEWIPFTSNSGKQPFFPYLLPPGGL